MFKRILFVCEGNICRSPMAEYLLLDRCMQKNIAKEITSAGLNAVVGSPADSCAVELMSEYGIDITQHRARQLTADILRDAELVLAMKKVHQRRILASFPELRGRIYCLGQWMNKEIDDPYRQSRQQFSNCLTMIGQCLDTWLPRLGIE